MTIQQLDSELAVLSRAEKAEILARLAADIGDAWPGIEQTPGIAGGAACILRTRIPVWLLENYRCLGWTEARILGNFPTLRAVDLVQAWAYASTHSAEIANAIADNESD